MRALAYLAARAEAAAAEGVPVSQLNTFDYRKRNDDSMRIVSDKQQNTKIGTINPANLHLRRIIHELLSH